MSYQVEQINKQRNKALKVLVDTRNKLVTIQKQATSFINQNRNEINNKHKEILDIEKVNSELERSLQSIGKSIVETDKIINPGE